MKALDPSNPVRISKPKTKNLYVTVTYLGSLLLPGDDRVDDAIQQVLRPPVTQMKNPLAIINNTAFSLRRA